MGRHGFEQVCLNRYVYCDEPKLAMPLAVFGGEMDMSVSEDDLGAWIQQTQGSDQSFSMQLFSGGQHFYTESHRDELLLTLQERLGDACARQPVSVLGGAVIDWPQLRDGGMCVHEMIAAAAAVAPAAKVAVSDIERSLTFEQMMDEARLLACVMQMQGVSASAPFVAVHMPHSVDWLVACLATLLAGGAVFPLDTNLARDHVEQIVESAGVTTVATVSAFVDNLPSSYRADDKHIVIDAGWQPAMRDKAAGTELKSYDTADKLDRVAFVAHSSGSTAQPKAIIVPHRAATACWLARYELYPYSSDEVEGLNIFFAWECLRAIAVGQSAFVLPDAAMIDTKRVAALISEHKVSRIMITPSLMGNILSHPNLDVAAALGSLKIIFLEGEVVLAPLVVAFAARLPGVQLVNCYSTWESEDVCYSNLTVSSVRNCKFAPAGNVMPNVKVHIVDKNMQPTMCGVPGEIIITSPALALGYLNDDERTNEKFVASEKLADGNVLADTNVRVYRTGDQGRLRSDGQLEVMGRRGLEIKIRGFKV